LPQNRFGSGYCHKTGLTANDSFIAPVNTLANTAPEAALYDSLQLDNLGLSEQAFSYASIAN